MGFNQTLVAKQVWRILYYPNSLAADVLKSLYFQNGSILTAVPGCKPSFLWKSLLWGKDLLFQGIRFRLGNGRLVKFFKDPWILDNSSFKPLLLTIVADESLVADFISLDGNWRKDKLNEVVSIRGDGENLQNTCAQKFTG